MRHPGYVGGFLFTVTVGLMLGSWWALLLSGVSSALFIVRTGFEDRTLQGELQGYADYAQHTPYRLFPGIW